MAANNIAPQKIGWSFWLGWVLINSLGFAASGLMFHNFPTAFSFPPSFEGLGVFAITPALAGFLFGAIPSLPISALGWWLLRRHISLSRWWILALPLGIGLLHFLSDGFPNAYNLSVPVLASGAVIGILQWNLLRREKGLSAWWIVAQTLGWYLGWALGFVLFTWSAVGQLDYAPKHALLGMTTGIGYSLLTGLAVYYRGANITPAHSE